MTAAHPAAPVAVTDVAANLNAALLERMWGLFDAARAMVDQYSQPSAEQWERLHRAVAAVPECQRDKPLSSAAEITRRSAELAELRAENETLRDLLSWFVEQDEKGMPLPAGVFKEASELLGRT